MRLSNLGGEFVGCTARKCDFSHTLSFLKSVMPRSWRCDTEFLSPFFRVTHRLRPYNNSELPTVNCRLPTSVEKTIRSWHHSNYEILCATYRASAMMVIMGLTPDDAGKRLASAT